MNNKEGLRKTFRLRFILLFLSVGCLQFVIANNLDIENIKLTSSEIISKGLENRILKTTNLKRNITTSAVLSTPVPTNISCNNNGTFDVETDDFISFHLNPTAPTVLFESPYTYNVTATQGGSSVSIELDDGTASTGIVFGFDTKFNAIGAISGGGDVLVTVTPTYGGHSASLFTVTDPGNTCSVSCNGLVGNTITYTYESLPNSDDQVHLPKFQSNPNIKLTGVVINYTTTFNSNFIGENLGSDPTQLSYIGTTTENIFYSGVSGPNNTKSLSSGIFNLTPEVSVPAQASWPGDFANRTLLRMIASSQWISHGLKVGQDPKLDPRWVTNLTGDLGTDDDMAYGTVSDIYSNTLTYSSAADLANFTGSGEIPIVRKEKNVFSVSASGNIFGSSTINSVTKFEITYTYDCIDIATVDDSKIVDKGQPTIVDLYGNDSYITEAGSIVASEPTNGTVVITDPNGTPIDPSDDVVTYIPDLGFNGTDTFTYTVCNNLVSQNCDTATIRMTVSSGIPMITQVHQTASLKEIEITNVHPTNTISSGIIGVYLFKDKSGNQTGVTPNFNHVNLLDVAPGESYLVPLDIAGGNDIVVLAQSSNSDSSLWGNRTELVSDIADNTSIVRIDEVLEPNNNYTATEWVKFVDDDLDPYRDLASGGPERHPHAPLLSEITNANSESNVFLGKHRINPVIKKSGSFTNGEPDITRKVVFNENYSSNSDFSVRELCITDGNRLTMKGSLLRVLDGVSLTHIESEIRLEGVSQIVQIHDSSSKVSGLGAIHVDQNSPIASIYRYNYFSSPVGGGTYSIADVLKVGTNNGSTNATSQIEDINFVSGYDGEGPSIWGDPIKIAEHWLYTFASANGEYSNWIQKLSTGIIPSTDGFIMKGPGVAQIYTYEGTPNDGELSTSIGAGNAYLVGNPYPSALSSKRFIEDNENSISGTLYFWQHAGEEDISSSNIAGHYYDGYIGGYAARNIAMGLAATQVSTNTRATSATIGAGDYTAPGAYIPIGQGFFIEGDSDGGPIVFNNSQREFIVEGSESVFFKSETKTSASLPIIKLGMNYTSADNKEMHRQIGVSFNSNNTFGFETGYDSELFDLSNSDMYWKFSSDASKYVIAGVEEISPELQVPLEIVLEKEGEVSIEIDEWNLTNQAVYLFDNLTNKFYPLHEEKAVLSLEKGAHTDRFFISFTKKQDYVLGVSDELELNSLPIFYNKFTEEINISPSENITISKVELYSILGQKVQSWEFKDHTADQLKLQINAVSDAVYITKVTTNKGIVSKKITVQ